ncbi:hypothetical protein D3C78_1383660 [compost metagenome]
MVIKNGMVMVSQCFLANPSQACPKLEVVVASNGGLATISMILPTIKNGMALIKPSRMAIIWRWLPIRPASGAIWLSTTRIREAYRLMGFSAASGDQAEGLV